MRKSVPALLCACIVLAAASASAQVIGTFTWQTQPHCNRISVVIAQQGGVYQLAGTDDLCGAGTAAVTGTAVPTAGGVAMGLTIAYPGGQAAHLSSSVLLPSASGTWTDADGHTGGFILGAATNGTPRPTPASAGSIGVTQLSPGVYGGNGSATTLSHSDHTHDARYYTKPEVDASLATTASRPTGTGLLLLGPASFIHDGDQAGAWTFAFATATLNATAASCFAAPVSLPNGAVVTLVQADVLDNVASNAVFYLYRDPAGSAAPSLMASTNTSTSGNSPTPQTISTSAIASPVIDTTANSYFAAFCLAGGMSSYGMRITFTHP